MIHVLIGTVIICTLNTARVEAIVGAVSFSLVLDELEKLFLLRDVMDQ